MPHRILIVEDEALLALDLSFVLEEAGYEVAGTARDMQSALRLAAKGSLALATMDVRLAGGSDGIETALQLWHDHEVRCLFVSASLDQATRQRALPARPIGFLDKPINKREITTVLAAHFGPSA